MHKFIVAGTFREYVNHIDKYRYDPREYVYVSSPLQLRGYSNVEGFYIGTYEQRPDIDQIREIIAIIKARK